MTKSRIFALFVSVTSAAAMLYVGLYQARVINHMVCPLTGYGCENVADAPFAKPFGVPDGYLGAGLYAVIALVLLFRSKRSWVHYLLVALAVLATIANVVGVEDMLKLGSFCFYCLLTTLLSPVLLWAVWASGKLSV
ncbi:MAG: hypothetical protein GC155_14160 [Alphaproteobacteria bacterium]|nr:hypothetical protein [Alphaproteobacteria bacterium]